MPRRCWVADAVGFGPTEDIAALSGTQGRRVRPLRQASMENRWCGRPNSNRDARGREDLKLVRLPVPPRPRCLSSMNQPATSPPEQCIRCANRTVRGGYVALPARDVCAAAEQLASGPLVEVLMHLLRVAARVEPCPWRQEASGLADAYLAQDLPPPLGYLHDGPRGQN